VWWVGLKAAQGQGPMDRGSTPPLSNWLMCHVHIDVSCAQVAANASHCVTFLFSLCLFSGCLSSVVFV
jgi:hypothetical protein